jgi:uncharacterized membrane protein HdeD (DUF308 family)
MISDDPLPMKTWVLWALLIIGTLVGAGAIFCAVVSIWVGLNHSHQDGFWMPILAGAIAIILIFALYLRLFKSYVGSKRQKEFIHIS